MLYWGVRWLCYNWGGMLLGYIGVGGGCVILGWEVVG